MKIGLLKNFLHYFNLRQGTILIAIFQMVTIISICIAYFKQSVCFVEHNQKKKKMLHIVFVRIRYDILYSGAGARDGDSRNGGERYRGCPRKRGFRRNIVEPSKHQKNGPGASQRNRLLQKYLHSRKAHQSHCTTKIYHPFCYVISEKTVLCICRNSIRDVLWSRHHSYPLYLYYITSPRGFVGNINCLEFRRIIKIE